MIGSKDVAELRPFADGGHDQTRVSLQCHGNLGVKLGDAIAEALGSRATREVQIAGRPAIQKYLHFPSRSFGTYT